MAPPPCPPGPPAGFEPVTPDNRRIIKQEWLAEALTMWGTATAATAAGGSAAAPDIRAWGYRAASALLAVLAIPTALTGARTPVIWFKICPALLATAAALLLAASFA